jgi:hypothetical protein
VNALVAAKNVPLAWPDGIVSEDGTVRLVEVELRATVPPPDPVRVTVQAVEAAGPNVVGLHAMAEIPELAGASASESVVDLDEPFSVAVTVTG